MHPKRTEAFADYERMKPADFGRRLWFRSYAEILDEFGAPDSMNLYNGTLVWHYFLETKEGNSTDCIFVFFDGVLIACD